MTIEQLFEKCLESQGVVLFAARIVRNPDIEKQEIYFEYLRNNISVENLPSIMEEFYKHAKNDLESKLKSLERVNPSAKGIIA